MWDLIVSVPDHCLSFYYCNASLIDDQLIVSALYVLLFKSDVCFIVSGLVISERFLDGSVGEFCPSQVFQTFSAMRCVSVQ